MTERQVVQFVSKKFGFQKDKIEILEHSGVNYIPTRIVFDVCGVRYVATSEPKLTFIGCGKGYAIRHFWDIHIFCYQDLEDY